jgi:hypothetical protein
MSVAKLSDKMWLIRVDATHFFLDMHDGQVTVTDIPSLAAHYTYYDADRACQALSRRGHRSAVVTDHTGVPVTRELLRAAQVGAVVATATAPKDNLPQTLDELRRIPVSEQRRRYKNEPAFQARVDALESPVASH